MPNKSGASMFVAGFNTIEADHATSKPARNFFIDSASSTPRSNPGSRSRRSSHGLVAPRRSWSTDILREVALRFISCRSRTISTPWPRRSRIWSAPSKRFQTKRRIIFTKSSRKITAGSKSAAATFSTRSTACTHLTSVLTGSHSQCSLASGQSREKFH